MRCLSGWCGAIGKRMIEPMNAGGESARLKRRHRRERLLYAFGLGAVFLIGALLAILLFSVSGRGLAAFSHTVIALDLDESEAGLSPASALRQGLKRHFPEAALFEGRSGRRDAKALMSAYVLEEIEIWQEEGAAAGRLWLAASDEADNFVQGAANARLTDGQKSLVAALLAQSAAKRVINWRFFTSGDSREPEHAGIGAALAGSFFALLVAFLLSFPTGVLAAIYLEKMAAKNRLTDFIEININNLAAVPSVIFGLLGLAVLLNFAGLGRSTPLVGGMVLAMMTLPTIIIASRAALGAVPPSIEQAALALGATHMQSVFHHTVPLALPGIMTGAIIGMAQALGESAPLLMIGMVAFIAQIPQSAGDPASVLPVQIYLWADSPERAFAAKAAAAILVLLFFLILMNAGAVFLRRRFQQKW